MSSLCVQKFCKLPFVALRRHDDTKLTSGQHHFPAALLLGNSHPRHPLHTTLSCPQNRLDAVTYTDVISLAEVRTLVIQTDASYSLTGHTGRYSAVSLRYKFIWVGRRGVKLIFVQIGRKF